MSDPAEAGAERGSEPEPDIPAPPGEGADLLTIGLLVFFVSVLVIVAALLTLPVILG